jgi:hypothetical protein
MEPRELNHKTLRACAICFVFVAAFVILSVVRFTSGQQWRMSPDLRAQKHLVSLTLPVVRAMDGLDLIHIRQVRLSAYTGNNQPAEEQEWPAKANFSCGDFSKSSSDSASLETRAYRCLITKMLVTKTSE